MLKKIVIAGSAAAVVLGAGTAALAASGSSASPSSSPSGSSSTAKSGQSAKPAKGKHTRARNELKRALHATWVTRDGKKSTTYVTHDAIRGTVTSVSANSITIKAADNVSQTYAVTSSTKVHSRAAGKGVTANISSVKSGNKVLVVGTGTSALTATQVLDATK